MHCLATIHEHDQLTTPNQLTPSRRRLSQYAPVTILSEAHKNLMQCCQL